MSARGLPRAPLPLPLPSREIALANPPPRRTGRTLASTRINFYSSPPAGREAERQLLAYGSHTKHVEAAWKNAGGVSATIVIGKASCEVECGLTLLVGGTLLRDPQKLVEYSEDGETVIE